MSNNVFYIKLLHSLLFFLIAISTVFVLLSAVMDYITALTWFAFGVAVVELCVLAINGWRCPLTDLAEAKGAEVGSVADLYLPKWFSDNLFVIFGWIFSVTCVLMLWRMLY